MERFIAEFERAGAELVAAIGALAATTVNLLGYDAPSGWDDSLLVTG